MSIEPERLLLASEEIRDRRGRAYSPGGNSPLYKESRIVGREHTKTEIGALKEFHSSWQDGLQLISLYRGVYPEPFLPLGVLNELTCGLAWLPVYLRLRATQPIGTDTLPVSILDTARATAGIFSASQRMLLSDVPPTTEVSAQELYAFANGGNAEGGNLFINQGNISCPAPERAVVQVVDAMLHSPKQAGNANHVPDWFDVVTQRDIVPSLLFGNLYTELQTTFEMYNEEKNPATERLLIRRLEKFRQEIHIALGYTAKTQEK